MDSSEKSYSKYLFKVSQIQTDPVVDSRELIQRLFSAVKDCPHCLSKLKEEAGINQTPTKTGQADTTDQACNQGELYHKC